MFHGCGVLLDCERGTHHPVAPAKRSGSTLSGSAPVYVFPTLAELPDYWYDIS